MPYRAHQLRCRPLWTIWLQPPWMFSVLGLLCRTFCSRRIFLSSFSSKGNLSTRASSYGCGDRSFISSTRRFRSRWRQESKGSSRRNCERFTRHVKKIASKQTPSLQRYRWSTYYVSRSFGYLLGACEDIVLLLVPASGPNFRYKDRHRVQRLPLLSSVS